MSADNARTKLAFAAHGPTEGQYGMTLYEYEMIAYRAAALTGLWSAMGDAEFSRTIEEERGDIFVEVIIAIAADRTARAMYDAAHPEEDADT